MLERYIKNLNPIEVQSSKDGLINKALKDMCYVNPECIEDYNHVVLYNTDCKTMNEEKDDIGWGPFYNPKNMAKPITNSSDVKEETNGHLRDNSQFFKRKSRTGSKKGINLKRGEK